MRNGAMNPSINVPGLPALTAWLSWASIGRLVLPGFPHLLRFAVIISAMPAINSIDLAHADTLYSIQVASDDLVTIDPATGTVAVIAPIGRDVDDTDLAALGGVLWVSDAHNPYTPSIFTDLFALNANTGEVLCSIRTTWTGSEASGNNVFAEGLTALDGRLRIAFTTSTLTSNSDHLGGVSAFDGSISSVISEEGFTDVHGHQADIDGLGTDASGMMIGVDGLFPECSTCSELHSEPGYTFLVGGRYGSSADQVGLLDITLAGSLLFATDNYSHTLRSIDPITYNLLGTVPLNMNALLGLAAVGGPGTLFNLGMQESGSDTAVQEPRDVSASVS